MQAFKKLMQESRGWIPNIGYMMFRRVENIEWRVVIFHSMKKFFATLERKT